jgi:hypothetical protein
MYGRPSILFSGRSFAAVLLLYNVVSFQPYSAATEIGTSVSARTFNGYARTKLEDGSFKPETYAFADGGIHDDQNVAGDSVSRLKFDEIAKIIAKSLQSQNYISSSEVESVDLMIMLFWGTTKRTNDKPTAYETIESKNVRILGFEKEKMKADGLSFTSIARDFYNELQSDRYFVVLKAYDFQLARTEKRLKLLWESRFSIIRQASDFQTDLPTMAEFASQTFGRETDGIFRPKLREGRVEIGEQKVLGVEDER